MEGLESIGVERLWPITVTIEIKIVVHNNFNATHPLLSTFFCDGSKSTHNNR